MTFTAAGISLDATQTRATTDNNWQGVTQVAVQVDGKVKPYDVQPSADFQTATLTSQDPFYWQSTAPIEVAAWHPYAEEMPDVVVRADQSDRTAYDASDYISAKNTVQFGQAANLRFTHRTAKVVVALLPGNDMTAGELANAQVTLENVTTGNAADGSSLIPYNNSTALLPAQTIQAGLPFIQVKLAEDAKYSYKPDAAQTLEAGKQYTYTITVNKTSVSLSGTAISNWEQKEVGGEAWPEPQPVPDDAQVIDLTSGAQSINQDGNYVVRGQAANALTITGGSPVVYLDGANIMVSNGPAISITGGSPVIHIVGEGNSVSSSNNTGIAVSNEATVTITGNSTADVLTAKGGTSGGAGSNSTAGAGIGSPIGGTQGGNIIIRNVTIHATGGELSSNAGGAGIGSSSNGTCGDIMIANAVIFADGGEYAAAIGMGCNSVNVDFPAASIGAITITNSDITANGGYAAAAIGFSACYTQGGPATYCSGKITITTDDLDKFLSCLTLNQGNLLNKIAAKKIGKGQLWVNPSTFRNTDNTAEWEGVVINGTEYKDGVD